MSVTSKTQGTAWEELLWTAPSNCRTEGKAKWPKCARGCSASWKCWQQTLHPWFAAGPRTTAYAIWKLVSLTNTVAACCLFIFHKKRRTCLWFQEICGPAGSPYENGIFKLEVSVSDRYAAVAPIYHPNIDSGGRICNRYPFEPPKVRFVTPIYHPNIDSGGRICLDTLNMPPKVLSLIPFCSMRWAVSFFPFCSMATL